jgi:HAD superfamily hydrolase (TIGR01450 family)
MKTDFFKNIKCFLLDLDGTLYLGGSPIDGAIELTRKIRESGRKLCCLTNNSSKSLRDYYAKIKNLGFEVNEGEIISSGIVAADYINANFKGKKIYLVGTKSLRDEFAAAGIELVEENPDVVVLGYDTETTYDKLARCCRFLRQGAAYIATHPDINCPSEHGPLPDAGSFMELIRASTGRSCDIICGKPHKIMADFITKKLGVKPEETAVVGDRLYTDILFGKNNGFKSILVYSGETDEKTHASSEIKADIAVNSVKELINYL